MYNFCGVIPIWTGGRVQVAQPHPPAHGELGCELRFRPGNSSHFSGSKVASWWWLQYILIHKDYDIYQAVIECHRPTLHYSRFGTAILSSRNWTTSCDMTTRFFPRPWSTVIRIYLDPSRSMICFRSCPKIWWRKHETSTGNQSDFPILQSSTQRIPAWGMVVGHTAQADGRVHSRCQGRLVLGEARQKTGPGWIIVNTIIYDYPLVI
jgi:hypothetical protein